MPELPRRRHTRPGWRHRLTPEKLALYVVAAIIAVFSAVAVAIVATRADSQPGRNGQPPANQTHDEKPAIEFAAALAPTREVYRYSVIEGGAHTPAELMAAINRDPVVADHYRSIDAEQVRAEIVDADRAVYVSYRRGDQIFWTSHKVTLRQGETILTDGVTQVRSRCGNCISLAPMLPVAEDEPEAAELDALAPAALALEGANPPAAGQSPFALEDVIAGSLVGGISRGMLAGNLSGPSLFDLPASEVGQGGCRPGDSGRHLPAQRDGSWGSWCSRPSRAFRCFLALLAISQKPRRVSRRQSWWISPHRSAHRMSREISHQTTCRQMCRLGRCQYPSPARWCSWAVARSA